MVDVSILIKNSNIQKMQNRITTLQVMLANYQGMLINPEQVMTISCNGYSVKILNSDKHAQELMQCLIDEVLQELTPLVKKYQTLNELV
jgi:hypothetical protein